MISICMATYNGEHYLREQLDSILACLSETDEVIVSDDGSSDGTLAILKEYADNDKRIRVLDGPKRGIIANFSFVISQAKGDVIFLSDQDDVWRPNKVDRVLGAFDGNGDCVLVAHNARIIDGQGHDGDLTMFEYRNSMPGFLKNILKNSYVGCCMAFRKELVPCILPIPENVEMHDWWIGLVAELVSKPAFLDDELIGYRRHGGNVSSMHHHSISKMISNRFTLLCELTKRRRALAK